MALKALITSEEFNKLDPSLQKEYKKSSDNGDRYQLDVIPEDGLELADVTKMRSALKTERDRADSYERIAKQFEGLDAKAARDAVAKMADFASWDPEKKLAEAKKAHEEQLLKKFEEDRKAITTKLSEEHEATKKRLEAATRQLNESLIETAAIAAIGEEKGEPALLLPIVRSRARVRQLDDTGRSVVEILDEKGTVELSKKAGSVEPMSIAEFVKTLKSDAKLARAFDGTNASGSGAGGSGGKGSGSPHTISAADALDPAKYRRAREAADKAGVELQMAQ